MPRRYSDYADNLTFFNKLSSFGSIVSIVGVTVFLLNIFISYVREEEYNYHQVEVNSLEWVHSCPPLHHTFNILPLIYKKTS